MIVNVVAFPFITYFVKDVITAPVFYHAVFYIVGINDAVVTHPTWAAKHAFSVWSNVLMFFAVLWLPIVVFPDCASRLKDPNLLG